MLITTAIAAAIALVAGTILMGPFSSASNTAPDFQLRTLDGKQLEGIVRMESRVKPQAVCRSFLQNTLILGWKAALDTDRTIVKYAIIGLDSTVIVDKIGNLAFKKPRLHWVPVIKRCSVDEYNDLNISPTKFFLRDNNKYGLKKIDYRYFFLFGKGYAIISLNCTLPLFLFLISQGISAGGLTQGPVIFLTYALGMGTMMTIISVLLGVVLPNIGDIIAYRHGLHFCREVNPYRNQNKV
ncbi:MAG: hypothetical protein WBQ25_08135 [Nitrososphaeraceae archaeon]